MLKAINTMANLIRPAADRRPTRRTRSRSPPPAEVAKQAAIHHQPPSAPILTRRLSKTLPQPSDSPIAPDTTPARAGARKRSITEVDTPEARPQSKTKQRRSYDDLSTWADDATKKLHSNVDDVASGASTPKPDDTPSAMVDKKSLRSKDAVRKTSVLAEIFGAKDYADILATFDAVESAESNASSIGSDDQITLVDEPLTDAELAAYLDDLAQKAARARADTAPDPTHVYTKRDPLDYSPYANVPTTADPLADSAYTRVHKRHEGKERAQRNRDVVDHQYRMSKAPAVLEDLEGEEWHKVFGIDKSERKAWETKRAHFILQLRTALDKQEALRDVELKKRRREKEKRRREREGTEEESSGEERDAHAKPHRPPRRRPSPPPTLPPPRRPPRPHGFLLDIPPAPVVPPTPFKSFYPRGHRPSFTNPTSSSTANPSNPSPRKTTRSTAPPPFGVALPSILTRVDDEVLVRMLKEDQGFAARGEPTEEVLLEDERSFQVFGLGGDVVTGEFMRGNERARRVRRRTRGDN